SGVVTGKSAGTVKITAASSNGKTAYCTVTVKSAAVAVTAVSVSPSTATVEVGKTVALTATVSPSNATDKTVTWSSANSAVASVSSSGVVTGKSAGTVKITAASSNGKTAYCTVTVKAQAVPSATISVNPEAATINVGGKLKVTAVVKPAGTVTWSSDKPAVAAVSSAGEVTAKSPGTAKITAKTSDGQSAFCTVTVKTPSAPAVIPPKEELKLTVDGYSMNKKLYVGDEFTYYSLLNAAAAYQTGDEKPGEIICVMANVIYDKTKLKLVSDLENTKECFPILGNAAIGSERDFGVVIVASDIKGFMFDDDDSVLSALRFEIIDGGETEIYIYFNNLYSGTTSGGMSDIFKNGEYLRSNIAPYDDVYSPAYMMHYPLGDADGDGKVTSVDATYLQRSIVDLETPDEMYWYLGDVDGDNQITLMDVTLIQYWLAGKKTPYSIGKRV
ncbi:MAG: Ig-like domain-containing protein, partial [Ruminococcus sp.]|nr:Ig-like domain-containing protein [Ruminococcus sp.]